MNHISIIIIKLSKSSKTASLAVNCLFKKDPSKSCQQAKFPLFRGQDFGLNLWGSFLLPPTLVAATGENEAPTTDNVLMLPSSTLAASEVSQRETDRGPASKVNKHVDATSTEKSGRGEGIKPQPWQPMETSFGQDETDLYSNK